MLETTMETEPVFVMVTFCEADVVAITCEENVSVVGEGELVGRAPVPLSEAVCGDPAALSDTVSVPVLVPVAVGVNVTLMVQSRPAPSDPPQLFVCAKSPEAVMDEIVIGAVPVLVKATCCAALVVD